MCILMERSSIKVSCGMSPLVFDRVEPTPFCAETSPLRTMKANSAAQTPSLLHFLRCIFVPCLLTGSCIQTASGPDAATRDETPPAGQHSEEGLDSLCGIFRCTDRKYPFPRPHSPSRYRTSGTEALLLITRYVSLPEPKG